MQPAVRETREHQTRLRRKTQQDVVCSHVLVHPVDEKKLSVENAKESKKRVIISLPRESQKETFQTIFLSPEINEAKEQAQQGQ